MQPHKEQRGSPNTSLLYFASVAEEHGICSLLVKGLFPSEENCLLPPNAQFLKRCQKSSEEGQGRLLFQMMVLRHLPLINK